MCARDAHAAGQGARGCGTRAVALAAHRRQTVRLLRVARNRCRRTPRRRPHTARVPPSRVLAVRGRRGAPAAHWLQSLQAAASVAPSLLAYAPATCARGTCVAVRAFCGARVHSRRAGIRPPGLLRAACVRCWRTRRWCVHMPRVSPGRVLVCGWKQCDDVTRPGCCEWRRRPPLLAHVCTWRAYHREECLRSTEG